MKKVLKKHPLTTSSVRKRKYTRKKKGTGTHLPAALLVALVEAQLLDPDAFRDEAAARMWLEQLRWREGRVCPYCFSRRTTPVPQAEPMPYRCQECRKYFSVRTGTVMQASRLPLRKWVIALFLMAMSPKGMSSRQMHRALDIAQSNALSLGRRIRSAWKAYTELFDGPVAVTDNTPVFPHMPVAPHALARVIFLLHDRKRWTH